MAATGLDQALSEWWGATPELSAIVPSYRVATEVIQEHEDQTDDENEDDYFDDCVVLTISSEPAWRTNSARGWRSSVKVTCLSINYDASKDLAQEVITAWSDKSYQGAGLNITGCRPVGPVESNQDDQTGVWATQISLEMNHVGV
jgi:hypothetical protein